MKQILLFVFLLIARMSMSGQVLINEYSCSNINTILDAFNQYEDWVELYNAGGGTVDITGYYLSDDPANPLKWQIPTNPVINAGARKMVFCSDRGVVNGTQLHPDFKLTQTKGEWFLLSDAAGVLVDSVHLNLTQRSHSRGRTTDGSNSWSLFQTPTPNATNGGSTPYTAYATKPIFNVAPGFYSTAQSITISSPDPNVTIRFTTDGSTPTVTSPIYTTPILLPLLAGPVDSVIRAKAFSSNPQIAPSFTETNSYFINESTTMNIISVSGDFTTLFGWNSVPIYCSYEYFDKNYNFIEEFEGKAQRHGHDSWAYPQKGFKVYADDRSGYQANMEHKYFSTSLRDTFAMVILKAGASDNYPANGGPSCHMRDAFAHTLAERYELDMDHRRYTPTIIFVNGVYWGVYEIRERVDKDYFEYYYGKKESKVENLRYWGGYVGGTPASWVNNWNNLADYINTNNMAIPANYQLVKDSLNVKSFAQYFIFNQYLVNTDWLNWNSHWWRGRGTASNQVKWRYALWDEDNILDLGQNYTGVGNTSYNNDPCDPFSLFQGSGSIKHTQMLTDLMQNTDFKQMYEQQWLDMLSGCFECTKILYHFDSIKNIISPEMPRHIARWGGTVTDWDNNIQYMRNQIAMRCQVVGGKLDSCFGLDPQMLKLNVFPTGSGTIALDGTTRSPYVWAKLIKGDSLYNLKATPTPNTYWAFDHWENQDVNNVMNPNMTTDSVQFNFKKKDSVIAFFKYFNYDSVDVTFDVIPVGTGTIKLNGFTIASYPTTIKLDRRFSYTIDAVPNTDHVFVNWQKNNTTTTITPNLLDPVSSFTYKDAETIKAEFVYVPPPPPPPPPPPIPGLTAVDKKVFIPNAFSPNADGKNDVFQVKVGKDAIGLDMSIFDRWGNEVAHDNRLNGGWDGTYKERNAEVGIYHYIIKVRYRDQQIETYKGDISLIR
ncbi:MAG: CotH kinase family protein [Chitinophagaceae bacterium]|nr:CotH kinase family protein [Chitinophagaceae bacterium]